MKKTYQVIITIFVVGIGVSLYNIGTHMLSNKQETKRTIPPLSESELAKRRADREKDMEELDAIIATANPKEPKSDMINKQKPSYEDNRGKINNAIFECANAFVRKTSSTCNTNPINHHGTPNSDGSISVTGACTWGNKITTFQCKYASGFASIISYEMY